MSKYDEALAKVKANYLKAKNYNEVKKHTLEMDALTELAVEEFYDKLKSLGLDTYSVKRKYYMGLNKN